MTVDLGDGLVFAATGSSRAEAITDALGSALFDVRAVAPSREPRSTLVRVQAPNGTRDFLGSVLRVAEGEVVRPERLDPEAGEVALFETELAVRARIEPAGLGGHLVWTMERRHQVMGQPTLFELPEAQANGDGVLIFRLTKPGRYVMTGRAADTRDGGVPLVLDVHMALVVKDPESRSRTSPPAQASGVDLENTFLIMNQAPIDRSRWRRKPIQSPLDPTHVLGYRIAWFPREDELLDQTVVSVGVMDAAGNPAFRQLSYDFAFHGVPTPSPSPTPTATPSTTPPPPPATPTPSPSTTPPGPTPTPPPPTPPPTPTPPLPAPPPQPSPPP